MKDSLKNKVAEKEAELEPTEAVDTRVVDKMDNTPTLIPVSPSPTANPISSDLIPSLSDPTLPSNLSQAQLDLLKTILSPFLLDDLTTKEMLPSDRTEL
jgi:hypothetical protein